MDYLIDYEKLKPDAFDLRDELIDFQITDGITKKPNDIAVDFVVSEEKIVDCGKE